MPLVLDGDTGIVGVLLTDSNGNVTFDTNTLYVDAPNNRVGIGTTSPTTALTVSTDGTEQLTLNRADASINIGNTVGTILFTGDDPSANQTGARIQVLASQNWSTNVYGSHITFSNDNSGTLTERLRITSGGDVSIGSGHGGFSGWRVLNMRQLSTGALVNFEDDDGTRAFTFASQGSGMRYQAHIAGGYHRWETNATANALYITDGGNVGIGTSNPQTKLHVHSSGSPEIRATTGLDSNTPTMQLGYSSGSGYFLRLGDAANNEDIILRTYGNSVFNGGNVGIGTSSPGEKLHVYGSGQQFIKVETTTTGAAAFVGMRMQDGDGDLGSIGDFGSGRRAFMLDTGSGVDMMFFTNNQNNSSATPRLTITSGGNVAIGTTPTTTSGSLHVGGNNGGLSVGAGNHAGYHIFSQHEGNIPTNTSRDVLQFEGPTFARYLKVTVSGYLCQKEVYFFGYQGWNGASNGNNVGSTVNGTQTFGNGTNSGITVQLECTSASGTSGNPRYKLKIVTGGLSGQLYDTTVVAQFFNPVFYPVYL